MKISREFLKENSSYRDYSLLYAAVLTQEELKNSKRTLGYPANSLNLSPSKCNWFGPKNAPKFDHFVYFICRGTIDHFEQG